MIPKPDSEGDLEKPRLSAELVGNGALFRSAMLHSPFGLAIVDADGHWIEVNPALARIVGYTVDELLATNFQSITHPDDLPKDLDALRKLRARAIDMHESEHRYVHKDGRIVWVYLNVSAVWSSDGSLIHMIAQVQDITARRRVEEELKKAEEKFSKVFLSAPVAICISRRDDGRFLDVNREFERIFGYLREDTIGRTSLELGMWVDENDRSSFVKSAYGTTRTPTVVEGRLVTKSGAIIPVSNSIQWLDIGGETCILSALIDLSERKRADEQRRALEQQLQQAQKMEAVGRLAAGVAHDFNNVLAVIAMSSDLLRERLEREGSSLEEVQEIRKAAARAARLTKQLLAFTRQQVLEPRALDLVELIDNLKQMLDRLVGNTIEIVTRLGTAACAVRADRGQVEQVIVNLVVNCRDAMPDGGRLTIALDAETLTAPRGAGQNRLEPGPYVVLSVIDTGVGMDVLTRGRMFEPFFTTKERGKGTGLGLSIAYGIVQQSGGAIDVESAPGRGTTVRVYLPRIDASEVRKASVVPESGPGHESVLLVEDDPAVRQLTRKFLMRLGYQVLDAAEPAAARELMRQHAAPIDLLLTDLVMPGGSGRSLATELLALRPNLKVLYMSGYTDDVVIRQGLDDVHSSFIQKPFSAAELAQKLRLLLDQPT